MHIRSAVMACIALLSINHAGHAQELVLAVGAKQFNGQDTEHATLTAAYRFRPFIERRVWSLAFGASASVSGRGDAFIGAGLWTRWQWNSGWFIDTSIMPGLYKEGTARNDLGSTLNFRSLIAAGYRFDTGKAVSASISHTSNAGLGNINPGENTFTIRYHISF